MTEPHAPRTRRSEAFSLIELVLVLAIVAAGAAIAVPRYANSLSRARLDAAATQVAARLAFARGAAAATSAPVSVAFDAAGETVTLTGLPASFTADAHAEAGAGPLSLAASPLRVDLSAADFGGNPALTFDARGRPDSGGVVELRLDGSVRSVRVVTGSGAIEVF